MRPGRCQPMAKVIWLSPSRRTRANDHDRPIGSHGTPNACCDNFTRRSRWKSASLSSVTGLCVAQHTLHLANDFCNRDDPKDLSTALNPKGVPHSKEGNGRKLYIGRKKLRCSVVRYTSNKRRSLSLHSGLYTTSEIVRSEMPSPRL